MINSILFGRDFTLPIKPLVFVAAIGGTAVAAAIGVNVFLWQDEVKVTLTATPTPAQVPAKTASPEITAETPPSFDVVRVDPGGDAVMAGRARPGSKVVILDNGKPIGEVKADPRGEWVFVPTQALSPGSRELTLTMHYADGKTMVSDDVVVLVVPEPAKDIAGRASKEGTIGALVLKTPRSGGASTVLQKPSGVQRPPDLKKLPGLQRPPELKKAPSNVPPGLSVETIDYDDDGRLVISGRARMESWVNVYLNNNFIGRAKSGSIGIWRLSPEGDVNPGHYTLRADQIDAANKVTARVSMPFSRAAQVVNLPPEPFVIVQPGNSLWRLARRTYGQGTRYTTIYQANKEQVKDPDLIFPGQVLALPAIN